jgi:hypothetical protein
MGQICLSGRCTSSTDTCQFDDQCGMGRLCVNNQCLADCSAASCPAGTMCVTSGTAMYCAPTPGPGCMHDGDCGTGQRCVNGACGTACTAGSTTQCPSTQYCTDDGVCGPDTRPHPFCDAMHPCQTGSECIDGVCRVTCTTDMFCRMVDVTYTNCGPAHYCLTSHEFHPLCNRQSECAMSQSCIDGVCQ